VTEYVIYNYFQQAQRAGELMAEQDAKMAKVIEQMQAEGSTLISIHYDY
jgi:hypothetical protein